MKPGDLLQLNELFHITGGMKPREVGQILILSADNFKWSNGTDDAMVTYMWIHSDFMNAQQGAIVQFIHRKTMERHWNIIPLGAKKA